MNSTPKTNCYEETAYYVDSDRLIQKQVVRVEPSLDREKVTCLPVIVGIAEKNNLNINPLEVEWDEIGRDRPDGIVHVKNNTDFWVEHTRISDHYQHFINESLKYESNKLLDRLGAPQNLFIRYPQNTQVRAARNFCQTWQSWEEVSTIAEALSRLKYDYSNGEKTIQGYRILENSYTAPRIYMLEAPKQKLEDMFAKEIKSKEAKYGLQAYRTVLIIDDETRAYQSGEIMQAAEKYGMKNISTFKGIYIVSFTGLENGVRPHWLMHSIKEF